MNAADQATIGTQVQRGEEFLHNRAQIVEEKSDEATVRSGND